MDIPKNDTKKRGRPSGKKHFKNPKVIKIKTIKYKLSPPLTSENTINFTINIDN